MDTTKKIKAILAYNNTNARQLAEAMDTSPQSLAGKMKRNTWNVSDLEKVAEFTETKLVIQFVNKDGTKI
jgi:DNA polymerase/3'-5' exonuclease PolX